MKPVELYDWEIWKGRLGLQLRGFAKNHPKLGYSEVITSLVQKIYKTKSGKMRVKTLNTLYELVF